MATDEFHLTNRKLDTVETGIEIVKEKVGIVDNRLIKMSNDWRNFDSRLDHIEKNIHTHENQMGQMSLRNNTHSAKLRALEEEIAVLKGSRSYRGENDPGKYSPSPYVPKIDPGIYSPRYDKVNIDHRNLEFQRDQQLSHRDVYKDQMYGHERENRYNTRYQDKNVHDESSSERKMRLDMDRIELHEGNFKPWTGRDALVRQGGLPAAQSGGVYLFIRTDKGALTEIRKALQEGRSVLANSGGQLKGIAHSEQIKLLEGQHGWNVRYPVTRRGEYWMERTDSNPTLNNIIIVLEFSDVQHADLWLMTSKFKSMQFPEPYGFESFIVPINYNPTYGGFTFLLTEYPEAFTDLIKDKYLPRLRSLLGRFYRYDDQMTIQFLSRGFPRDESKASRGNWINRRSSTVGVRFRNEYDALDFWRDTEFRSIREEIKQLVERDPYQPPDKWFHPITVVFTLNELRV